MLRLRTLEYKWLVAIAFIFGIFMDIMDSTVVNVALPTLGRQFHAGNDTLEWVVTGYLLSLAVWIPASGWIGDRFGTKRTFMFALAMFTLSSALCGLAWNIGALIGFRLLQGVGGGMMTPVGTAMLFRAFPPAERAKASTVLMIPTVLAPALGPVFGGWLVDTVGWRWIFYINLPIGMLGFLFTSFFVREHREKGTGRFDIPGFLLSGSGLALALFALSRGPNYGWTSAAVLGTALASVACFAALVYVELHIDQPLLALRLFGDRMFRNANMAFFMATGSLIGVLFLLPLLMQQLRGLSAARAGLLSSPQALGMVLAAQVAGRIYPKVGPRRMIAASLTVLAITSFLFVLVDLQTSLWAVGGIMLVRGMAMAFTFIPLQTATFSTISMRDTGRASSLFSTTRQVGSSVGVALLATTLVSRTKVHVASAVQVAAGSAKDAAAIHGRLLGFHDAFAAAVVIGVAGIAFAFLIHDADAASTLHRAAPSEEPALQPEPVGV